MVAYSIDEHYIARCLELAELGRNTASPNPMVGAVVLDAKGRKAAEGFHRKAGEAHAEVVALDKAGDAARGGTLYVNLEPCNHTGRTPPCTERIIKAGIERVVCGTLDPNPLVAGQGRDMLQNARISVRYGFLEAQCLKLNEAFFYAITHNRPFVTLKLAMTLDGKIATRSGHSQWITGSFSRQYVHHLRAANDAIITTADTVIKDNPSLTVRYQIPAEKKPVRVILDRRFRLNPDDYAIFNPDVAPTWVFTSKQDHHPYHAQRARDKGIRVYEVRETGTGLDIGAIMSVLWENNIHRVMVEGGGRLAGAMLNQHWINKLYLFYGNKIITDPQAAPGFASGVCLALPNAPTFRITETRHLQSDMVIEAYPLGSAAPAANPPAMPQSTTKAPIVIG